MTLLEELKDVCLSLGLEVELAVFKKKPPDQFVVLIPLYDDLKLYADNKPEFELEAVRLSLFSKTNYKVLEKTLTHALLEKDITITDRRYVGFEQDSNYHHFAIDCEKEYIWR